jgi:tRNA (guanine-N7-)-methyltransferase
MTEGNSRSITSNQSGPHEKLEAVVLRHLHSESQKPFNQHTLDAFKQVQEWLSSRTGPLILDSCCGVGESTAIIAGQNPKALVIGVDKSALRTAKHQHYQSQSPNNIVVRADLNDFWRLAVQAGWKLHKHYLLYPNPYPKLAHLQRRWHASAAFSDIVKLAGTIEIRSNWKIYIEEFALALTIAGHPSQAELYSANNPQTPFERKYWSSGQSSWRVLTSL